MGEWRTEHREKSADGVFELVHTSQGDYDDSSDEWKIFHVPTRRCIAEFSGTAHETAGGAAMDGVMRVSFGPDGTFVEVVDVDGKKARVDLSPYRVGPPSA